MPIKLQCESCNKVVQAPDRLAGKRARCKCGAVLVIPAARAAAELAAALESPPDFDAAPMPAPAPKPPPAPARRGGIVCPNCQADLPKHAVLCTSCGMYFRSGKQLSVSTDTSSAPSDSGGSAAAAVKRKKSSGDTSAVAMGLVVKLLKWGLVLAAVGGLAWGLKSAISFDPRQQAKDALAKIKPGMTVQQVVDAIALKPHEVHVLIFEEQPGHPFAKPVDKRIGYQDDFMKTADQKLIENGFTFLFRYTERDLLIVEFDSEGKVVNAGIFDYMKMLGM